MQMYTFREESIFKGKGTINPQIAGEIIAALERKQGKSDIAIHNAMWRAAKGNPDHPLYTGYTWDEKEASEAHWRTQSAQIRRSIAVVDTDKPEEPAVRAFHSIVTPDLPRAIYTTKQVRRSADLQISLLRQAERDLLAFERRYQDLVDICDLVRMARDRVSKRLADALPTPVAP
jgi:hypothetical protein